MNIDLSMIAKSIGREQVEEAELSLTSFVSRLGDFPIISRKPAMLHITNHENAVLCIQGRVELETVIPCSRCLTEVRTPIHFDIDKRLRIEGDTLVDDEMEEPDYLNGFDLDVEKLVYAEILVNWPMKVLCRDDCKGVCRVCGMNLNEGACSCQKTELDPRMAAIQDIYDKFKEV
ncbi:MAG: DUF177 domain-containing protein [Blautia sp.]|nr:DUF177 domain-containing protein [Blautia sp.]